MYAFNPFFSGIHFANSILIKGILPKPHEWVAECKKWDG
jgi:hypothetical protein